MFTQVTRESTAATGGYRITSRGEARLDLAADDREHDAAITFPISDAAKLAAFDVLWPPRAPVGMS